MEQYDIAIVGGGPVGMFAAFYAGLRDTKTVLVESLAMLGGQVSALYPDKRILDVAGFVGLTGRTLIEQLSAQMAVFPVDVQLETTVIDVQALGETTPNFLVTTNKGQFQAKTVIVATGKGAFKPRELAVTGVDELLGKGVHYFVRDKHAFDGRDVMIAGGGDSAVDMALMLDEVTQTTRILHRREQFRALEQSVKALQQNPAIIQETPKKITAIQRQTNGKLAVHVAHVKDATQQAVIEVDDLVINYGFVSENKTVMNWQIQPELVRYVYATQQNAQTSIPGVFAIGDASHYDGKADLIATGFGEAPVAVNAAIQAFDPSRGGPGHSSSMVL